MGKAAVIGLDIGTTQVRAVEVRLGTRGSAGTHRPVVVRYGDVALPPGAVRDGEVEDPTAVSSALRQLWSDVRFSTRDVVIGVGNQRVVVRELDLPWMPMPHLRASLPFQVQDMLPMSTDDAVLDYYPTGELEGPSGRMVRGMLVAATRDTVTANVRAVEGAGLRPRMVDLNPFALLRALTRGESSEHTVALVEIGARVTHIVIARDGVPRFVRMLPSGGHHVTEAVAGALGITAADAETVKREVGIDQAAGQGDVAAAESIDSVVRPLVDAIRNTFVYYSGNNPGARIDLAVLTGGGAQLAGLDRYLASATRLPVSFGDPLSSVEYATTARPDVLGPLSSLLAVPLGLAYGVAA